MGDEESSAWMKTVEGRETETILRIEQTRFGHYTLAPGDHSEDRYIKQSGTRGGTHTYNEAGSRNACAFSLFTKYTNVGREEVGSQVEDCEQESSFEDRRYVSHGDIHSVPVNTFIFAGAQRGVTLLQHINLLLYFPLGCGWWYGT